MAYINGKKVSLAVKTDYLNISEVYPIGSIYMSVNSTSPASLFGGTWEQLQNRFLLGAGSSYTNGATGGEATHTLTVNEMPQHRHRVLATYSTSGSASTSSTDAQAVNNYLEAPNVYTAYEGGSQAHNNMPPYLVVYMWKRVS